MQFWDLKMSKMTAADCSGVGDVVMPKLSGPAKETRTPARHSIDVNQTHYNGADLGPGPRRYFDPRPKCALGQKRTRCRDNVRFGQNVDIVLGWPECWRLFFDPSARESSSGFDACKKKFISRFSLGLASVESSAHCAAQRWKLTRAVPDLRRKMYGLPWDGYKGHYPSRRPRCLLCIGRTTDRSVVTRQTHCRWRRSCVGRILRG